MSDADKKPFVDLSDIDRARFEEEMKLFREGKFKSKLSMRDKK
jgi:hypothetical protein